MRLLNFLIISIFAVVCAQSAKAEPVQWSIQNGGNGHYLLRPRLFDPSVLKLAGS